MNEDFYENDKVIHAVVEAERSKICHRLIIYLISKDKTMIDKKRILDIGCGDGSFIKKFKEECEVFGIDISLKALKKAEKAGIETFKLDVSSEKLPIEDQYFDIVYMGDIIEHLINPDFAIKEARRVLKSSGFLVLSTPNLACWSNRILLLFGIQPLFSEVSTLKIFGRPGSYPIGHLRLFTLKALKEFLNYHGFKIVSIAGTSFLDTISISLLKHLNFLKFIDVIFAKIPSFASILIIVGKVRQTN